MIYEPEYRDFDYYGGEPEEPECNCEASFGAIKPVYCPVHEIWSDDLEIAIQEQPVKMGAVIEQMLTNTNRVMSAVYQAMDRKEVA